MKTHGPKPTNKLPCVERGRCGLTEWHITGKSFQFSWFWTVNDSCSFGRQKAQNKFDSCFSEHVSVLVFPAFILATETIQSLYSSPNINSSWFLFSKMFLGVPMMPPRRVRFTDLFPKRKGMVYKCTNIDTSHGYHLISYGYVSKSSLKNLWKKLTEVNEFTCWKKV